VYRLRELSHFGIAGAEALSVYGDVVPACQRVVLKKAFQIGRVCSGVWEGCAVGHTLKDADKHGVRILFRIGRRNGTAFARQRI